MLAIFTLCMSDSLLDSYCLYRSFVVILININSYSVSIANRLNIVLVISKTFTILTVIIVGLVRIAQGLLLF